MKILVLGWYGHANIGDESYKLTFPKMFPEHEFIFTEKISNQKFDLVIVGGGNVLKPAFLNQLKKVTVPIYGISVGLETFNEELKLFKHIYVRDLFSLKILQDMGVSAAYLPDLAFLLEPNKEKGMEWIRERFNANKLDLYPRVIAIIINAYLMNGMENNKCYDGLHFIKFSYDMARVIDETHASFIFLPFGCSMPHDDRIANSWIASKCKFYKKNLMIFDKLDIQETLNIMAATNLNISSRLHSSIFSCVSNVPFIDITHHSKNENFLQSISYDNSISYWNFSVKEMKDRLNKEVLPAENLKERFYEIRFD